MLDVALSLLACPVCGSALARVDAGALGCAAGHRHDVARQGYVNLLGGRGAHGLTPDSTQMVLDRERIQSAGRYAPIARALAAAAGDAVTAQGAGVPTIVAGGPAPAGPAAPPVPPAPLGGADASVPRGLLDVGGGTGYYAVAVLHARPDLVGVSLDLSRPAARRAARAHGRLASVVGDAWAGLPLRDASCDLVTCVFAPRPAAEILRVLAPGGSLLVVTPGPGHLRTLVEAAGMVGVDERKDERLADRLAAFEAVDERVVSTVETVGPADAAAVVGMGPSAHHVRPDALHAALAQRESWPLEIDVRVRRYRRP
ncbi:putative RNA methyltransferase [Agilicoccus flavus]|uniref:putative RNA methyltransferase n=1 Tax=Agilicoccus flavus TaxID=2775968 RepID=UPI001CF6F17D|nr:methyltransferase domain-containing protein [Agilicoccus flavus]